MPVPVLISFRLLDALKSGGLLAGSAFTLDIEGVSTLRFGRELMPARGVFGVISNLDLHEKRSTWSSKAFLTFQKHHCFLHFEVSLPLFYSMHGLWLSDSPSRVRLVHFA